MVLNSSVSPTSPLAARAKSHVPSLEPYSFIWRFKQEQKCWILFVPKAICDMHCTGSWFTFTSGSIVQFQVMTGGYWLHAHKQLCFVALLIWLFLLCFSCLSQGLTGGEDKKCRICSTHVQGRPLILFVVLVQNFTAFNLIKYLLFLLYFNNKNKFRKGFHYACALEAT